jgi:hypothetical protein
LIHIRIIIKPGAAELSPLEYASRAFSHTRRDDFYANARGGASFCMRRRRSGEAVIICVLL